MGDISSGMSSSIMQIYLKQVLESFFHSQSTVRHFALSVITLTLNQGLIHPVQVCSPSHSSICRWGSSQDLNKIILKLQTSVRLACFIKLFTDEKQLFFLVCSLLGCHGNRPRANHEEQGWSTVGGDWQEIFRIHPRECCCAGLWSSEYVCVFEQWL